MTQTARDILHDRVCSRCQTAKPRSAYWKQLSRKDGLQAACIKCMTNSHRKWRTGLSQDRKDQLTKRNVTIIDEQRRNNPRRQLYRSIKSRAKKAGMDFDLEVEDIKIPEVCPVLGIEIRFEHRMGRGLTERDIRPSVDRIDNSKGYTKDNIVVVSYRANRIKSDANVEELEAVARFYRALDDDRK